MNQQKPIAARATMDSESIKLLGNQFHQLSFTQGLNDYNEQFYLGVPLRPSYFREAEMGRARVGLFRDSAFAPVSLLPRQSKCLYRKR